jgi:hypothetical protein
MYNFKLALPLAVKAKTERCEPLSRWSEHLCSLPRLLLRFKLQKVFSLFWLNGNRFYGRDILGFHLSSSVPSQSRADLSSRLPCNGLLTLLPRPESTIFRALIFSVCSEGYLQKKVDGTTKGEGWLSES